MICNIVSWIIFVLLITLSCTHGNWMYLGVTEDTIDNKTENCNSSVSGGLVEKQLRLCKKNPNFLTYVSQGIKRAIQQCQNQFQYERWNCTTYQNDNVFGPILTQGMRQSAFIYSILAAGVTDSITRACHAGLLEDCSCMKMSDKLPKDFSPGCSENVQYGMSFSRRFVDAPESTLYRKHKHVLNKVNLHNTRVGRKVVHELMELRCKCHGPTGSCEFKTCWKVLPRFYKVGQKLKEKYGRALKFSKETRKKSRKTSTDWKKPTKEDLVYLHVSPSFCDTVPEKGILGTKGRLCISGVSYTGSCDLLCCGRGYISQVIKQTDNCTTCRTLYRYTCK